MPLGVNAAVSVDTYVYASKDYFLADRYRFQSYLADSANNTINDIAVSSRTAGQNTTWTAESAVHLVHHRLKQR